MRFASVFIPNFPLQTAIRLKTEVAWPDGKKIPTQECALAILDGKPPWVTVVAVNEKAWRAGVEVGMTKLQAESCPSVVCCHRRLTLERWGIHCFRELAALPSMALAERLGQEGLRLQRLAQGAEQRLLVPMQPPLQFEEAMEMDEPVETLEPLLFLLNSMLGQLCSRLAARALAVHRLDLILDLDVHDDIQLQDREKRAAETSVAPLKDSKDPAWRIHQRTLQLPVPMRNSHELFKLLQLDLSAHPPMALVKKVTLKAEPARPRVTQAGLFIPAAPEPEQLEVTLGRIRHVVGDGSPSSQPQRVGSAEILDTHRPGAFRMLPFCPTGESRAIVRPGSRPHTLALRVFRPPLAARVELGGSVPRRILIYDLPTVGRWRPEVMSASGPSQT